MSDDDADAVLDGSEALRAGGARLKAITNGRRLPVDSDGERTEDAR
jgi:hypothetical protein